MPDYDVTVVRRQSQYQQVRVSAGTPGEAEQLAEDRVEDDKHWIDADEITPDVEIQAIAVERAEDD
jgi:hypothetical protein